MDITFWGVRGSVATSGPEVAQVGGSTSCVEVREGEHRLVFDAGTGIRALGNSLMARGGPCRLAVFFSHLHWDHLQGFPFFGPAYVPSTELMLYGPGEKGDARLAGALARQMQPPSFPVTLEAMRGRLCFRSAEAGVPVEVGPFKVTPFALPHPNGCMGYRVESQGAVFVYATDVELSAGGITPDILAGMEGADALCMDAQYTPEEYGAEGARSKKGWGHSTMMDAAQIARTVGARRLFLFHHDPSHDDAAVEAMAARARAHFPGAQPAREGMRVTLGDLPFTQVA